MTTTRVSRAFARIASASILLTACTNAQEISPPAGARVRAYQVLAGRTTETRTSMLPDKCGLAVISAAIHARAALTAGERSALGTLQSRSELQTTRITADGLFKFHFDTTGTDAPALLDSAGHRIAGTARAFVDSATAVMAHVYEEEIVVLGYPMPLSDGSLGGGPEYDIYIRNLGNLYGETTPDNFGADGATSTTFIEIHNDFSFVTPAPNRGIPALKVTLAHEFHHAIQIGSYGFWLSDVWFHEITSVWMEDVVYHGVNDYLNYLFDQGGQFWHPDVPLTSNNFIMYSRGILGKYLTKRFGRDMMRHVWENAHAVAPLPALDLTLHQLPSPATTTLGVAFAEWTLWNYYTGPRADTARYYNESPIFPVIAETYYDLISPTQQVNSSLSCLAGDYFGYATGTDTVTVALANLSTDCASANPPSSPFILTVSRNKPGDSFRAITGNLFLNLDVTNPSQWVTWAIGRQGPSASSAGEGTAYPDPFSARGGGEVYFPANADQGTLSVFSSGMELVYSGFLSTQSRLGQRVVAWNGLTDRGVSAPTGVYIFLLTLPGRTVTGKFALVRQ